MVKAKPKHRTPRTAKAKSGTRKSKTATAKPRRRTPKTVEVLAEVPSLWELEDRIDLGDEPSREEIAAAMRKVLPPKVGGFVAGLIDGTKKYSRGRKRKLLGVRFAGLVSALFRDHYAEAKKTPQDKRKDSPKVEAAEKVARALQCEKDPTRRLSTDAVLRIIAREKRVPAIDREWQERQRAKYLPAVEDIESQEHRDALTDFDSAWRIATRAMRHDSVKREMR